MAEDDNENYEGRLRALETVILAMPNAEKLRLPGIRYGMKSGAAIRSWLTPCTV
jgi:hypothetical protein